MGGDDHTPGMGRKEGRARSDARTFAVVSLLASLEDLSARPRSLLSGGAEHLETLAAIGGVQRSLRELKQRIVLDEVGRCLDGAVSTRDVGRVDEAMAVLGRALRR